MVTLIRAEYTIIIGDMKVVWRVSKQYTIASGWPVLIGSVTNLDNTPYWVSYDTDCVQRY